ncbi:MAG TPA: carboxypeptidase-like regulatory domain-containing protein [Bryobacteraceae bacterium]|nr:carboxypeptidase-like regulatory domain-containing protein [Bryobacteraceae bacterium]
MFSSLLLPPALLLQLSGVIGSAPVQTAPPAPPVQQAQQPAAAKQPPASITGQIISISGEPVNKAEVSARRVDVRDANLNPTNNVTTSDRSGVFTLSGLEPGRYVLSARKAGFVEQQYGAARGSRMGTMLSLGPGQELRAITLKLTPHAVISGKVTDEDGEPVMFTHAQALQQRFIRGKRQWVPAGGGQVNDLGEYRIPNLQAGRYIIAVAAQSMRMPSGQSRSGSAPEESYITTYYPGVHDPSEAATVEVAAGAEMRNVDLRLKKARTYRISGKVSDAGKPGQNAMVMLMPAAQEGVGLMGMGRNASPVRNPEGAFEIGAVVPGTYMLVAQRMGGPGERSIARQEITVGNSNVENVVLTMTNGFEVAGTLRIEGKTKVSTENLRVFLEPQASMFFPGGSGPGSVKADGTFRLENITAEKYRVNVFPQTDFYVKTVRLGNQEMRDGVVDFTNGAAGPIEVVLSTDGAAVEGAVHDSKGRPTGGVIVALIPDAPNRDKYHLYRQSATDNTGAFSFRNVPPGSYKVFAWEQIEDAGWTDPALLARYENEGKSLALREAGQERVTMRFIAPEGGSRLEQEAEEREKSMELKPQAGR